VGQTVFVVEDEVDIARLIGIHLQAAGYRVEYFSDGYSAVAQAEKTPPALMLLDVQLPKEDGFQVCKRIRGNPALAATAIVFVTARNSELDRVLGLELGGDDYITKPFSPTELVARVRAVLRRSPLTAVAAVTTIGTLEIDSEAMSLRVAGRLVETTTTEFRILETLAKSVGRVVSRERLLELVWGRQVDPRSVDVYVSRLRDKIESEPASPRYLKTIRGVGYRLDMPAA
jgi:two-component system phosphate regulon response regulator PhoB